MQQRIFTPPPVSTRTYRRRSILASFALAGVGGWTASISSPGRATTARAEQTPPPPVTTEAPRGVTFVGSTSDPGVLVAVVLLEDKAGKAAALS